jgi:hypothetical protein
MHRVIQMGYDDMYQNGEYLRKNPTWDVEDSPWKAAHILEMLSEHNIHPRIIGEVGCGAGEILVNLQRVMGEECVFWGYDISPQAIELCKPKSNARLHFLQRDLLQEHDINWDVLLAIDVIEHVEDYLGFLRAIKGKATYKIFHVPLEFFAISAIYSGFLRKQRLNSGHLHYFTRDLFLQILSELDYDVLDARYTPGYMVSRGHGWKDDLLYIPRRIGFLLSRDLTVRIFGGYSLLVLAR